MRRLLIDHARHRKLAENTPEEPRTLVLATDEWILNLLDLGAALTESAGYDGRYAHTVELRSFETLTIEQTATVLGVSDSTIEEEWRNVRAWLVRSTRLDRFADAEDLSLYLAEQ